MEEELIRAVAQEYMDRLTPLAHLIDCLADVTSSGMDISRGELWDILDEMNVSAYAVFPVHALLSCLRPADAGPMAPPGMRFLHEILSWEIIPTMHRRVEQAIENPIGDRSIHRPPEQQKSAGTGIDQVLGRDLHGALAPETTAPGHAPASGSGRNVEFILLRRSTYGQRR